MATSQTATVTFVLSNKTHHATTLARGQTRTGVWTADWDSQSVPNGAYTLRSTATDAAGHRAVSVGVAVTVHNPTLGR